MSYQKRLARDFLNAPVLPLTDTSRYVLFSDCHRGTGNSNDNFLKNQHLYFAALQYYYEQGYTYIELGDGDELWENRNLPSIVEIHNNVFWLLSLFRKENRLYMLYGNHDMEKRNRKFCEVCLSCYFCTSTQCEQPLFPNMSFYPAIILRDYERKNDFYLTHGHQADLLNSVLWRLSRFLVRNLWRPLEHFGVLDPTSAAKNYSVKRQTEERLLTWAKKENHVLITGHTHRPTLGSPDSPYCNTGSCVHPRCITCIEIQNRQMFLVKWSVTVDTHQMLRVTRTALAGPY